MNASGTCTAKHAVNEGCADPECYRLDPVSAVIGHRIRYYREQKRITQADLARRLVRLLAADDEELVVTTQQISDYEHGRRVPSLPRARAFADALGVPMDLLCGRMQIGGERYPSQAEL